MFKEDETHYCPMCQEWAEKYERLKKVNEELKKYIERMDKPEIKVIDIEVALQN